MIHDSFSPHLVVRDHFYANDAVADATIGELDWEIVAIGNAGTFANLATTNLDSGFVGAVRHTTDSTADGDGDVLRLFADGLLATPGMAFRARVRYPDITGNVLAANNVRIGFQDSVTATAPTVGIYFLLDAGVITCHVDSADHGDNSVAVTLHPDLTGGTTAVLGSWLTLEARASERANAQSGPDEVDFYVNGVHVAKVPGAVDNDEEVELSIAHWQDSGGTATLEADVDYVFARIPHPQGPNA